ncbi:MAG: prolipoprotein diacylglyceryl transferase [Chloroflexota bacterium]|nr:prolipoprotein diacylglyceryl transferase [Chloroflexota bacterium]
MVTDPVAFTLGPLVVRWYGILIMLGVFAGAYLAAGLARRKGQDPDRLWEMLPLVVFTAIAGARLYWAYLSWGTCCANDPWEALRIWHGGISIHGAIVFGLLAIWLYTRLNRLRFFRWVDCIVPGMALGQAIGRWGNFTNQEAFGAPTSRPWGIYIAPENRPLDYAEFSHFHPTFFYESVFNLANAVLLSWIALRIGRDRRLRDGDVLWIYLILYGLARFAIETLRTDSLMLGPFKAAHVVSGLTLLAGIIGLAVRRIGWRGDDRRPDPATAAGDAITTLPAGDDATAAEDSRPRPAQPVQLVGEPVPAPGGQSRGDEPAARET